MLIKLKRYIGTHLQNTDNRFSLYMFALTLTVVFVSAIAITLYYQEFNKSILPKMATSSNTLNLRAEWGQLGDYFGGVLNPIFGFASFVALLVTIYHQSIELKLSRTELELTRKELSNSVHALSQQNKAIELQSFEQTFFSWINTYQTSIESISIRKNQNGNPYIFSGRAALTSIWKQHFDYGDIDIALQASITPETVLSNWDGLINTHGAQIEPLFKNLRQLLLWINQQPETKLNFKTKSFFVDILSSQLCNWELMYLYCYGLTDKGLTLKPLLEKYCFFQHMNFDDMYIKPLKDNLTRLNGYTWEAYEKNLSNMTKHHS